VIVAQCFVSARAWIDLADPFERSDVLIFAAANKTDFGSYYLGARASVAANHRRA
jgi:hypothetical protein